MLWEELTTPSNEKRAVLMGGRNVTLSRTAQAGAVGKSVRLFSSYTAYNQN